MTWEQLEFIAAVIVGWSSILFLCLLFKHADDLSDGNVGSDDV